MFAAILLAACAAIVPALAGDVTPTLPAPGDTFTQGGSCHIAWAPDTSGVWKTMNIELMTGNNIDMVHLSSEHSAVVLLPRGICANPSFFISCGYRRRD